jgi:hypothetical protein
MKGKLTKNLLILTKRVPSMEVAGAHGADDATVADVEHAAIKNGAVNAHANTANAALKNGAKHAAAGAKKVIIQYIKKIHQFL